jgi:4-hydroxy-tetrahydrodipicolinate reductase
MGRRILELTAAEPDLEIGGAFEAPGLAGAELTVGFESSTPQTIVVGGDAAESLNQSEVLIDFTLPEPCVHNVGVAAELGKPAVVGTTGLSDDQQAVLAQAAEKIPIVHAPNMSVGVNLLFKLTSRVASILGLDYNVEIIETHHNQKQDSPSGTAVRLAERAAEALGLDYAGDTVHGREGNVGARPMRQIGMHAVRGGDVVGEHLVSFIGNGERIDLAHRAQNRDNFARGALRAARFVANADPGLYDMQDVLGLK